MAGYRQKSTVILDFFPAFRQGGSIHVFAYDFPVGKINESGGVFLVVIVRQDIAAMQLIFGLQGRRLIDPHTAARVHGRPFGLTAIVDGLFAEVKRKVENFWCDSNLLRVV